MKKIILKPNGISRGIKWMAPSFVSLLLAAGLSVSAQQTAPANDVTAPLHLMKPDYPTPYGAPAREDIIKVLDRVYTYLDKATPAKIINSKTKDEITDFGKLTNESVFAPGDFRLTSYEWGVTYAGMLNAG